MNGCIKSLSFLISILNFRATIYYGMLLTTITNGVLKKTLKKSGKQSNERNECNQESNE